MSLSTKTFKINLEQGKKKAFYVVIFTLLVNAVVVIFNFLFTLLGHYA